MPRTTIIALNSGRVLEADISKAWRFAAALPLFLSMIAVSRTYFPGGAEKLRSKEMKSGADPEPFSASQRRAMSSLNRSISVPLASSIVAKTVKCAESRCVPCLREL